MKKVVLYLFALILISSVTFVSALDIVLTKANYYPGETLQAQIPDVFTNPLAIENIGIYSGNAVHKTPVEQGMIKFNSKYYYYALLPNVAGNYSLKIENQKYKESGVVKTDIIVKNFTITSTNTSYLSFNPAAISTTDDFSILVKAYGPEQKVGVSFDAVDFQKSLTMYENEQTIAFSVSKIKNSTFTNVKINSYSIPVIVTVKSEYKPINPEDLPVNFSLSDILIARPNEFNVSITSGLTGAYPLKLINKANNTPIDINISSSNEEINVTLDYIDGFKGNTEILVKITSEDALKGYITVSSSHGSVLIPVYVEIVDNINQIDSNVPEAHASQTCSSLGGRECNIQAKEECTGDTVFTRDISSAGCCLGTCEVKKSSAWIWGIVIVIVIIGIGAYLYLKSKKESEVSANNMLKKRAEDFEKRMTSKESVEVKKSLGNI